MGESPRRRARRVRVESDPLVAGPADYADAFEVTIDPADARSAEEFARDVLANAPRPVYWLIDVAHRFVLRFDLAPRRSPEHIMGWAITHSEPGVVRLEAGGPIVRAVIVGRRPEPSRRVAVTSVFFENRAAARILMRVVAPVHRSVAKLILERAAARPVGATLGRRGPHARSSIGEASRSRSG